MQSYTTLFLVATSLTLAVQGREYRVSHLINQHDTDPHDNNDNNIPPLCREASVTPVSCADAVTRDALLPHPDHCRLFYYCVSPDSAPICRQCNAGLHFNPRLYVCDAPERAGCGTNETEWATEQPIFPGEGAERCAAVHAPTPVSCENAPADGLMPHPDDCSLYYQCITPDTPAVCRPCNAGLHFNPLLRVCDLPDRAGCVRAD